MAKSKGSNRNHDAEQPAEKVEELDAEKPAGQALNLLIVYQGKRVKKHDAEETERLQTKNLRRRDAEEIAEHLKRAGHKVTLVSIKGLTITGRGDNPCIHHRGKKTYTPLSSFDGATLRSWVTRKETREISQALREAGIPVYQDYSSLLTVSDKRLSQEVFDDYNIPTPRTRAFSYRDIPVPRAIEAFIDSLGAPPYVVKANRGSRGKQVVVADSKEEAVEAFWAFHAEAQKKKRGGALIQEYIESDPERSRDYRIRTVVGVSSSGKPEVTVVAAAKRLAEPGKRITNVAQGADKIRVALSEEEAHAFYVEKQGMPEEKFRKKLEKGEIEILSPEIRELAEETALAFGVGNVGIDIIVGACDQKPRVLEVNSFPAGTKDFEVNHGFSIYKTWAHAFAGFIAHKNQEIAQTGGSEKTWRKIVVDARTSDRGTMLR